MLFVTWENMEGENAETSGNFGVHFLLSNLLEYSVILLTLWSSMNIKPVCLCDPQFYKAV